MAVIPAAIFGSPVSQHPQYRNIVFLEKRQHLVIQSVRRGDRGLAWRVARRIGRGPHSAAPNLMQKLIPLGIPAVILVANRVLVRVILMVILCQVKIAELDDLGGDGLLKDTGAGQFPEGL